MDLDIESARKGFELQTENYEKTRPSYPFESVEFIINTLNLDSLSKIIDLGCGTGKLTRILHKFNLNVTGVEPSSKMREEFHLQCPNIEVIEGSGQIIPFADKSLDVVFCAQAFHWFSDESSLKEIHRVLKSTGTLVLIWNDYDINTDWLIKLRDQCHKYVGKTPQYCDGNWRNVFNFCEKKLFTDLSYERFKNFDENIRVSKQHIWERVLSISYISCLDKEEQENFKIEILEFLQTKNPDFIKGKETVMKYFTDLYWTNPI